MNLYIANTHMLDPRHRDLEPDKDCIGKAVGETRMFLVDKGVDAQNRTATFYVSSGEIDRYGEIVSPEAFDDETIAAFMQNPVMLAGHQHSGWGGEPTVIGHWLSVKRSGKRIEATCTFASTELAEDYWKLVQDGSLRACSIGFMVREWEMREVGSGNNKMRVRVFTKIELLEISIVAVPANRQALMKAAGFSVDGTRAASSDGSDPIDEVATKVAAVLKPDIQNAIKNCLSVEPGGDLEQLVFDVLEAAQSRGVPSHHGSEDDPNAGGKKSGDQRHAVLQHLKLT